MLCTGSTKSASVSAFKSAAAARLMRRRRCSASEPESIGLFCCVCAETPATAAVDVVLRQCMVSVPETTSVTACFFVCLQQSSMGSYALLVGSVLLAVFGHEAGASPFGVKLAAVPHTGIAATSAATFAEVKQHAVSAKSDKGKHMAAAAAPLLGLQMGGMDMGMGGDMGQGNKLDENDPAAAMTKFIAPEDAPPTDANGTIVEDSGLIGADGKRTGKLAPPPDFTFPIVFASVTSVIMVIYFTYACCFQKEEPRKKGDSYM